MDNTAPGLVCITEDLDGNPRYYDDNFVLDTGIGPAPIVDMGAYERQSDSFSGSGDCPGDVDENQVVDFTDLVLLLSAWGPCSGCPEDVDGDGSVGFTDLVQLLGGWGPC